MKNGFFILYILIIYISAVSEDFRTAAQNSAPKYYTEDGEIQGICVDIIQELNNNPDINISGYDNYIAFQRLQEELSQNQLDIFFGFKKTSAREEKYRFIDIPLYQLSYVVATKVEDTVDVSNFDDVRLLAPHNKILTIMGSATGRFLERQDSLNIYTNARSLNLMLEMLYHGRGRYAFFHDLGLYYALSNSERRDDLKILNTSFLSYSHYAAVSREVSDSDFELISDAIRELAHNGTLNEIQQQYGLIPTQYPEEEILNTQNN